jgi:peptide/nickel transport system substrate-binding protein
MKRILCFFGLIILLTSCVEKRDLSMNSVVIDLESFPDGLHIFNSNTGSGSFIHSYTQTGLVSINSETEKFLPILLNELPKPDSTGLLYYLELNDDAKWDDGKPLTTDDIIFSWKITLCPLTDNAGTRNSYRSVIDSVFKDKSNSNGFWVRVKAIHYSNMNVVSGVTLAQKTDWDPKGVLDNLHFNNINSDKFKSNKKLDKWFNDFNSADNAYKPENLKGLGPYQIAEIENKSYVILTRKENWWGEGLNGEDYNNFPEKLIFKTAADPGAGYLSLKREDIDILKNRGGVWISKFNRLKRNDNFNKNYKSRYLETNLYRYLGMNMRPDGVKFKPFFTDIKVRKAMAHLAPIDDMLEFLYYGEATRQASIVAPFNKQADTSLAFIPFDLDKASELLDEAGWIDTDGDNIRDKMIGGEKIQFKFKLNYYSDPSLKEIALVLKESMKRAGIELIPNPLDFGTLFGNAYDHKFDAILAAWGGSVVYSDPTQVWSSKSWAEKGSNFIGFGDAESDSLIKASNISLNEEAHLKAYKALQKKIYDEQPYIFFWSEKYVMACHKRFDNIRFYRSRPNVNVSGLKLNYK